MFDFINIKIENFKSYKGVHEFEFPDVPGLYFLTGTNNKESRLESNGAGKSTLLDAIFWCLYGRTPRGLKASDVVTWGEKSCAVTINLCLDGGIDVITRTQNPNTLTLNASTVEQDYLTRVINLSPDAFLYSVMMPQYNQSFYELTPAAKLSFFSQIMGLDYWLIYSQKAAKLADALTKEVTEYSKQIRAIEISLESSGHERDSLEERENQFDVNRAQEVKRLRVQADDLLQQLDRLTENEAAPVLAEIEEVISEKLMSVAKIREAQEIYTERLNKLNQEYGAAATVVETAFEAHQDLTKVGAKCPVCLQKVGPSHIKAELKKAGDKLEQARVEFKRIETEWHTANKFVQKAVKDRDGSIAELEGLRQEERKAARAVAAYKAEEAALINRLKVTTVSADTEANRINPYTKLLNEKEASIKRYEEKKLGLELSVDAVNADFEAISFWVAGFKRVRLFIIEETLRALEVEVNSNLTNLGLAGWQITFDVERETKAGTLSKGFMVFVKAAGATEATRAEAWSGGESQRLQLACDLGLANLIMHQAGHRGAVEFYDEPSKHLSKAGLVDLAETLHQRAVEDNKRIFLVDHNMPEFGDFAGVISVTKDAHGHSSIT